MRNFLERGDLNATYMKTRVQTFGIFDHAPFLRGDAAVSVLFYWRKFFSIGSTAGHHIQE